LATDKLTDGQTDGHWTAPMH